MHFCFLLPPVEYYSPVSGGAIAIIAAACGRVLEERGHRVTVLAIRDAHPRYPVGDAVAIDARTTSELTAVQRRVSGLVWRARRWDWPHYEYYARSFTRALRGLAPRPDVVIACNDLRAPALIRAATPRARIALWLQNECSTNARDHARALAAADHVLACSEHVCAWTASAYGLPAARIACVPSGVDLRAFRPRADWLATSAPLRALFIGRLDPNKGPDLVLDAVRAVRAEGHAVEITVVPPTEASGGLWRRGRFYDGDAREAAAYFALLHAQMAEVGATWCDDVQRNAVPEVVRAHDVAFVLSRAAEPFGLVALEAMASGLAVIAADRGGLPEACGGAALLVDPDDRAAIIAHLRRLATDDGFLRAQKERSVARAARAPWEATVDRLLEVVAESPRRQAP